MRGKGRTYPPLDVRFWQKVDKTPGFGPRGDCWKWTGCTVSFGYGQISRGKADGGRVDYAHRVSYELANEVLLSRARRAGPLILHSCDNPSCVNPEHLFLGSDKDNNDDMRAKNRWHGGNQKGEANPQHVLTDEEVRRIRGALGTYKAIADDFGVCQTTAWKVKNRKAWTHVV
jgi:hypothetical protein